MISASDVVVIRTYRTANRHVGWRVQINGSTGFALFGVSYHKTEAAAERRAAAIRTALDDLLGDVWNDGYATAKRVEGASA